MVTARAGITLQDLGPEPAGGGLPALLHPILQLPWPQSWSRVLGPRDPPSQPLPSPPPADQDGAEPSANSVSAHNLLRLHGFTGHKDWMDKCVCLLTAFSERMRRVPVALPEMVRALSAHQQTLKQVGGREGPLAGTPGGRRAGAAPGNGEHRVGLLGLFLELRSVSVRPRVTVCTGVSAGMSGRLLLCRWRSL